MISLEAQRSIEFGSCNAFGVEGGSLRVLYHIVISTKAKVQLASNQAVCTQAVVDRAKVL